MSYSEYDHVIYRVVSEGQYGLGGVTGHINVTSRYKVMWQGALEARSYTLSLRSQIENN